MSKKSNVHPDHYKTAGRLPQGQDVVHESNRQKLAEQEAAEKHRAQQRERQHDAEDSHQESTKEGKQSSAKKSDATRDDSGPAPSAKPVAGAHGNEPSRGSQQRGRDKQQEK